ncbi:MAG: hypothetical protein KF845_05695 [Cyclobacteriaceae bacterium]|nr:hypothetical protein [Cyclobacteriaceae bacterium]
MKKHDLLFSLLFVIIGFGCEKDGVPKCFQGTVIGYEYCSNAVLIQVVSPPKIGGEITYYDKTKYENVVRAPAQLGEFSLGTIYFTYRPYDKEKDLELFKPQNTPCQMLYGAFDIPTIVIIDYSTLNCLDHEG